MSMVDAVDAAQLREAIAARLYQNCLGQSWQTASPTERRLFLTGANEAIGMVVEALERAFAAPERWH